MILKTKRKNYFHPFIFKAYKKYCYYNFKIKFTDFLLAETKNIRFFVYIGILTLQCIVINFRSTWLVFTEYSILRIKIELNSRENVSSQCSSGKIAMKIWPFYGPIYWGGYLGALQPMFFCVTLCPLMKCPNSENAGC